MCQVTVLCSCSPVLGSFFTEPASPKFSAFFSVVSFATARKFFKNSLNKLRENWRELEMFGHEKLKVDEYGVRCKRPVE
jgi:hypothetical protein